MKIGIFGLGYVGLTTAACLLQRSFSVIGYEVSQEKHDALARGECPLSEPGVREAIVQGLREGRMEVAREFAVEQAPDILLICVGTPNRADGQADLGAVRHVLSDLQSVVERSELGANATSFEVVIRSTVPPGTLKQLADEFPTLFATVPVMFYPEFLREGTAMRDFYQPPQTVVGVLKASPAPRQLPLLLTALGLEYELVDAITAEALKLSCNAFHALKVTFANEVGRLAAQLGGDGTEVMRLLVRDTDLNISPKYLLPGAPYGGSCLPKDTRAFAALAGAAGVPLSLIPACEPSNREHTAFIVDRVLAHQPKGVAVLGIAFKRDTDDVRESPSLAIIEALAERGVPRILIHDFLVQPQSVLGVNKAALDRLLALPAVEFVVDLATLTDRADVHLVLHNDRRYQSERNGSTTVMDISRWIDV